MFSFWSDHGRDERDLSFEWSVIPDIAAADMPARVANPGWRVLANTVRVQAVSVPQKNWLGLVFHEPGTFEAEGTVVTADRPCLLIIEERDGRPLLRASDPLQQGGPLKVSVNGREHTVELPGYPHAGRTVEVAGKDG
jgi:hypothetical protein